MFSTLGNTYNPLLFPNKSNANERVCFVCRAVQVKMEFSITVQLTFQIHLFAFLTLKTVHEYEAPNEQQSFPPPCFIAYVNNPVAESVDYSLLCCQSTDYMIYISTEL